MPESKSAAAVEIKKKTKVNKVDTPELSHVDQLLEKAVVAREAMAQLDQEAVDKIVKAMALAGQREHMRLAHMAVDETGRGVVEDKITKNIFATEYIYHSIKYDRTVGVIEDNEHDDFQLVADPVGVVCGVTPVTNPTSTTMFKSIISAKTRNPIVFAFHPSAQKCSSESARVLRDAAIEAGAPENCIQWIEFPSIDNTSKLMNHKDIAVVLATGGSGMVRAAYSTGKPALGVGAGNVPAYIDSSANLHQAVHDVVMSKSFDNGMICASEQAAIVHEAVYVEVVSLMKGIGCYFTTPEETQRLSRVVITEKGSVNSVIVGKPAHEIAAMADIKVPVDTKVLCAEIEGVGPEFPLSREKLSPVLAIIKAKDSEAGIARAVEMLEFGGLGHTASCHAQDDSVTHAFSLAMPVGRVVLNTPSTHGAIGNIYNTNIPSLTLGCGTYGGNSTTANVSAINLMNVKRVAKRRVNMQWFKLPQKVYFEANSIQYLEKMQDIGRVFIVTDETIDSLGYVDKIRYHLERRSQPVQIRLFNQVEPDPSLQTIQAGAADMRAFNPDVIIALGGGSPIDAAKGMWLFYEHPDADFEGLSEKFLDIRKRVYKFPKLGEKAQLVAIPTTSGTGSEVTSFAVITDKETGNKYPLADYELTPDVAIIDPNLVMSVPRKVTADTGLDVLTHAVEAYVSVMASDYTDALAMKAIELVFDYLPASYSGDRKAREKMHNASTIAGMAFANAFLGINHSMAHKLGAEFHIPHGLANALLLPWVIEYNGESNPTKLNSFPKYDHYQAPEKYAEIARKVGLPVSNEQAGVKALADAVRGLIKQLNLPSTLKEAGIEEGAFLGKVRELSEKAFKDQCTTANPRLPLISELEGLLKKAYYGK